MICLCYFALASSDNLGRQVASAIRSVCRITPPVCMQLDAESFQRFWSGIRSSAAFQSLENRTESEVTLAPHVGRICDVLAPAFIADNSCGSSCHSCRHSLTADAVLGMSWNFGSAVDHGRWRSSMTLYVTGGGQNARLRNR